MRFTRDQDGLYAQTFWSKTPGLEWSPSQTILQQLWAKLLSFSSFTKWGCYHHWDNLYEMISSTTKHYSNLSCMCLFACSFVDIYFILQWGLHETTQGNVHWQQSDYQCRCTERLISLLDKSSWRKTLQVQTKFKDSNLPFIKSFTQHTLIKPLHGAKPDYST